MAVAWRSATQAPVMAAVRVPPSAWSTSQSMLIWPFAERPHVCHRAQGAPDQPLDLLGAPALLALGGLRGRPRVWVGARQHAVIGP
jgi:hypothetical protein